MMSRMKSSSEAINDKRHSVNTTAITTDASQRTHAVKKRVITSTAAKRALVEANAIAARRTRPRRARMRNCARMEDRLTSEADSRPAAKARDRSMTRPKRLVIVNSNNPTPEIRITGPMAS